MKHAWARQSDQFVGTSHHCARLYVWQCHGCGLAVSVSEFLNESLFEFLDRSGHPEDCETAVVQYVLEQ